MLANQTLWKETFVLQKEIPPWLWGQFDFQRTGLCPGILLFVFQDGSLLTLLFHRPVISKHIPGLGCGLHSQ